MLDIPGTIEAINDGLATGEHSIGLAFQTEAPAVAGTATAADLGITELVVSTKTYFTGSSPERIQNIRIASSAFHGLLVAPGQTLSMADGLGDISLDSGYAEALIIIGNRTVKGVGGGVCQVSTTLFRAAFYGGYQLDERYPHAYRVSYYEQGPNSPGPGLDATVFAPLVDFKFTNDTDHWLLMETYMYGNALEWKFYSAKDGRVVSWETTGARNVVEAPEPLYKENSDLPEGKIKQVDWAGRRRRYHRHAHRAARRADAAQRRHPHALPAVAGDLRIRPGHRAPRRRQDRGQLSRGRSCRPMWRDRIRTPAEAIP